MKKQCLAAFALALSLCDAPASALDLKTIPQKFEIGDAVNSSYENYVKIPILGRIFKGRAFFTLGVINQERLANQRTGLKQRFECLTGQSYETTPRSNVGLYANPAIDAPRQNGMPARSLGFGLEFQLPKFGNRRGANNPLLLP